MPAVFVMRPVRSIADLGVACTLRTVRHDVEFTEGRLRGRRVEALGAVEVSSAPEPPDPAAAREWMRRAQYTRLLEWSREASLLRERLAFLHASATPRSPSGRPNGPARRSTPSSPAGPCAR